MMNPGNSQSSIPSDQKENLPEIFALSLLLAALLVIVFFSPRFFAVSVASHEFSVMALLTPIIAIGTCLCLLAVRGKLKLIFLDIVVVAFVAFTLARNISGPWSGIVLQFAVYGLCLYLLAAIIVQKRSVFKYMLISIVGIAFLCILYGLIEYVAQDNYLFVTGANLNPGNNIHRIYSAMEHPVIYGSFLVQILPFTLLLFSESSRLWMKLLSLAAFASAVLSIVLTFSKGSWIALVFIAGLSLIYLARNRISRLAPTLAILAMCTALIFIFWQQAAAEVTERSESSVVIRSLTWSAATRGIRDNPWTGLGFHQGNLELERYLHPKWRRTLSDHGIGAEESPSFYVDNAYLAFFLEEGAAGFALWLTLLGSTTFLGVKASGTSARHHLWAFAALVSIVGFAIDSFTFDSFLYWQTMALFWVSAGIVRGVYQKDFKFDIHGRSSEGGRYLNPESEMTG